MTGKIFFFLPSASPASLPEFNDKNSIRVRSLCNARPQNHFAFAPKTLTSPLKCPSQAPKSTKMRAISSSRRFHSCIMRRAVHLRWIWMVGDDADADADADAAMCLFCMMELLLWALDIIIAFIVVCRHCHCHFIVIFTPHFIPSPSFLSVSTSTSRVLQRSPGPIDCSQPLKNFHAALCFMFCTFLRDAIVSRLISYCEAFTSRISARDEQVDFCSLSADLWTFNHTTRPLFSVGALRVTCDV